MRKAMLLLAVFGFVGVLWAQSPFDGTWKIDIKNVQIPPEQKPQVYVIQNGTYECSTCDPKFTRKADGTDQPAPPGVKTYDTMAIKVVNDKTVEFTNKKGGKVVSSIKQTVSTDTKTMTVEIISYPEGSKQPVTIKGTMIRVAAGPAGSHAYSGSWRTQKINEASENALTSTYKSSPDGLMMSSQTGESFEAKFDGKDYPIKGGTAGRTVSLAKVNERSIDMTNKSDGKITSVAHMTVSADGKTMTTKSEIKASGTTATFIAIKQ